MSIEQALLESLDHEPGRAAELLARSPGIGADDLDFLRETLPGDGRLLPGGEAFSIDYLQLPSGMYCVAQTAPSASLEPCAMDTSLTTRALVFRPRELARFANNPFALLRTVCGLPLPIAVGAGNGRLGELESLNVAWNARPFETELVAAICQSPGLRRFESLLCGLIGAPTLALSVGAKRARLIAALLNCLPVDARPQLTFSSGLTPSARRGVRLCSTLLNEVGHRLWMNDEDAQVLDLERLPMGFDAPRGGWTKLVVAAINRCRLDWLATQLRVPRSGISIDALDALGDELYEQLDDRRPMVAAALPTPAGQHRADVAHGNSPAALAPTKVLSEAAAEFGVRLLADLSPSPADLLGPQCPQAVAMLEELDDVVFEAIAGKTSALETLRELWPKVRTALGPDMLDESRSQYLRHAMSVWRECVDGEQLRNPNWATAAVDVTLILLEP